VATNGLFIGVMTGTSVDGLDIALVRDSIRPEILSGRTFPLPEPLRNALLTLAHDLPAATIDTLGHSDAALGEFTARSVLAFLVSESLDTSMITAIGSHGQTIRHRPRSTPAFTLQIGDPHRIAEMTGITTVSDFRRRDIAAGGQGAPLVPVFHQALFADTKERRIVLNIGGIANVTGLLPGRPLTGFDTGPGNALLDLWVQEHRALRMDEDGQWASTGKSDSQLLRFALEDPYFSMRPPKTTGREYFNRAWLGALLQRIGHRLNPEDVQASLVDLVVRSIVRAISEFYGDIHRLIVCGGGRRNSELIRRLREAATFPVDPSEDWGVDGDSLEAAAFAWLAARALSGEAVGEPAVTGASAKRVLGVVYPGSGGMTSIAAG
jgi:anhydro-N-acetylmuramic acid kinase